MKKRLLEIIKLTLKSRITRSAVAILLLYLIISKFQINLEGQLKQIKNYYFLGLVLIFSLIINPIVSNARWKILLQASSVDISLPRLVKISFKAIFYSFLLPSSQASDGFRMYSIEKIFPEKRGTTGGTVIADRMIGFIIFCLIASAGSIFLPDTRELGIVRFFIFAFTLLIIFVSFLITNQSVYKVVSKFIRNINFFKTIFEYIDKVHFGLTKIQYKRVLPKTIPLVIVYQFINIAIAHFIFTAFGVKLPFYYHLALIPVIQVLTLLPISLASLGFREGLFIYFYRFLDIPEEISFGVSLLYLILTGFASAIIGGIMVLFTSEQKEIGSGKK